MPDCPPIAVVDDDEFVRESLPDLIGEFGYTAHAFSSAEAFLTSGCVAQTKCLVLDVAMPGMTGPDLQVELLARGHEIRTIFITAHGADTVRPQLVAQGAVACLSKPFSDTALLAAIKLALEHP